MKVGILVPGLQAQGGCEPRALCLARQLKAAGHQVTVYTCRLSPSCYPEIVRSLAVVVAGGPPRSRPLPPGRLRAWLDMRRLARVVLEPVDVLNPHGWPAHWAAVSAARRPAGRPWSGCATTMSGPCRRPRAPGRRTPSAPSGAPWRAATTAARRAPST